MGLDDKVVGSQALAKAEFQVRMTRETRNIRCPNLDETLDRVPDSEP